MNIQEQKQLADWVLEKLNPHYSILLAGGAPRDWYFDQPGNDLDFFIAGEEDPDFVANELGIGLAPLGEKEKYENAPFNVYEGEIQGQVVQFIFQAETSAREIVKRFPCAMSWAWYDGECHYDNWFKIGARYKIMPWPDGLDWSQERYIDKMFRRFPHGEGWCLGNSFKLTLSHIGGSYDYPVAAPEVAPEPLFDHNALELGEHAAGPFDV